MQEFVYPIIDHSNNQVNPKAFSLVALSHALKNIYSMLLSEQNPSLGDATIMTIGMFFEQFEQPSMKGELTNMVELLKTKVNAANEKMNADASTMFLHAAVPDIVRKKTSAMSYILIFMYEVVNSLVDSITIVTDEHSELELDGQYSHLYSHLSVIEFDYDGIVWRYELPNLGVSHNESSASDGIIRVVNGINNPVFSGDSFDIDILFSLISAAITTKLTCDYFIGIAESDDKTVSRAKALAKVASGDWHEYLSTAHDYPYIIDLLTENYPDMPKYEIEVSALSQLTTLDASGIEKVLEGFAAV